MSNDQQGPRISRGEEAMYGELAAVVRQVSTAYVALSEGRDVIADRLREWYEEMHLPAGVDHSFGTAAEGTVRREWEDCFQLVANAESELQKALFGVTKRALSMSKAARVSQEDAGSLPLFEIFGHGEDSLPSRMVTEDLIKAGIELGEALRRGETVPLP